MNDNDIKILEDLMERAKNRDLGVNSIDYYYALQHGINQLKEQSPVWNDASKRPPRHGRYLVWGLYEFTPDHNDQPNAYWQTRIATWSDHFGWDTKVKFWRELPDPPENKER